MSQQINIYAAQITPKQKKDLLGIYQDYLYFSQGLELVLKNNNTDSLAYMYVEKIGWNEETIKNLPWYIACTRFFKAMFSKTQFFKKTGNER